MNSSFLSLEKNVLRILRHGPIRPWIRWLWILPLSFTGISLITRWQSDELVLNGTLMIEAILVLMILFISLWPWITAFQDSIADLNKKTIRTPQGTFNFSEISSVQITLFHKYRSPSSEQILMSLKNGQSITLVQAGTIGNLDSTAKRIAEYFEVNFEKLT